MSKQSFPITQDEHIHLLRFHQGTGMCVETTLAGMGVPPMIRLDLEDNNDVTTAKELIRFRDQP